MDLKRWMLKFCSALILFVGMVGIASAIDDYLVELVPAGDIQFVNETGKTIHVIINDDRFVGVPIPPAGITVPYPIVNRFCLTTNNVLSCKTSYLIDDTVIAEDHFDATSGTVIDYSVIDDDYNVSIVNDEQGILRKVTITKK